MGMELRIILAAIQESTSTVRLQTRTELEIAWGVFLANRTEADFHAWRHQRDWTERKYAMWERGELLPSQRASSMMPCPCGTTRQP
jgi:hypothetical protein